MFLGMDKFNADNLLPINYWFCKLVALKVAASESYSDFGAKVDVLAK